MATEITACTDASLYADTVCDYAVWAAAKLNAPVAIVHVLDRSQHAAVPDLSGSLGLGSQEVLLQQLAELDEQHSQQTLERGHAIIAAARQRMERQGLSDIRDALYEGTLVETLSELQQNTRLLILGKRGFSSATEHGQVGLNVERIIRNMQKPVLLTQQHYKEPAAVMMAYDGSATAQKSLEMLASSPFCKGLPVHLVMASAEPEQAAAMLSEAATVLSATGFAITTAVLAGEPAVALQQYQQQHDIDIMVMGAYGHSRIRQFFVGSTTTAMICKAKCALLILR